MIFKTLHLVNTNVILRSTVLLIDVPLVLSLRIRVTRGTSLQLQDLQSCVLEKNKVLCEGILYSVFSNLEYYIIKNNFLVAVSYGILSYFRGCSFNNFLAFKHVL